MQEERAVEALAAFLPERATVLHDKTPQEIGMFTKRYLLGGIAYAPAFAAGLIYIPALNSVFGTAPLAVRQLAIVLPFPFIVWAADELSRLLVRHRHAA